MWTARSIASHQALGRVRSSDLDSACLAILSRDGSCIPKIESALLRSVQLLLNELAPLGLYASPTDASRERRSGRLHLEPDAAHVAKSDRDGERTVARPVAGRGPAKKSASKRLITKRHSWWTTLSREAWSHGRSRRLTRLCRSQQEAPVTWRALHNWHRTLSGLRLRSLRRKQQGKKAGTVFQLLLAASSHSPRRTRKRPAASTEENNDPDSAAEGEEERQRDAPARA